MQNPTSGIHHITAIAGDPQRNLDFYAGTLGLRLVKRTVNFDDPGTYHFYYGDRTGRPGTLLTFFPWAGAFRGRSGAGQATETAFAVPSGSLGYWEDRLGASQVGGVARGERFGAPTLRFNDPDGMVLELVESQVEEQSNVHPASNIPGAAAIRRFHGTTLTLRGVDATAQVLTDVLGLVPAGEDGPFRRFAPPAGVEGGVVDLLRDPNAGWGSLGAGSVHHVAWRAADGAQQLRLRGEVLGHSISVTPVVDRQYFQSIYFREPGGVLFEVATDGPGFLIDEPEATLGESLKLPPQFEAERAAIEQVLAPITLPGAKQAPVEA
jgi:glyoxalase family protein